MAAVSSRPKSVAYVNAAFGLALGAILGAPVGVNFDTLAITVISLSAGLLATFLVLTNPVDFVLKRYLGFRLSRWPREPFPEAAGGSDSRQLRVAIKSIVMSVYAESFFGFERSAMISLFYLMVTLVVLILEDFNPIKNPTMTNAALGRLVLFVGLILSSYKFARLLWRAPSILGNIAAYTIAVRRPAVANLQDVEGFRRSLSEGNWYEAVGWRQRIELQLRRAVQLDSPRISAEIRARPAALGSVHLVARIENASTAGATNLEVSVIYDPPFRTVRSQLLPAISSVGQREVLLDSFVPTASLQTSTITVHVEFSDESETRMPMFQTTANGKDLVDDMLRDSLLRQS